MVAGRSRELPAQPESLPHLRPCRDFRRAYSHYSQATTSPSQAGVSFQANKGKKLRVELGVSFVWEAPAEIIPPELREKAGWRWEGSSEWRPDWPGLAWAAY